MANYVLTPMVGDMFRDVAYRAKDFATEKKCIVEFDFNGIKCLVNETTNTDLLYRDYSNAFIMKWDTVGPNCEQQYDEGTQKELDKRNAEQDRINKEAQELADKRYAEARSAVEEKIKNISFEIIPGKEKDYEDYVKVNSDNGYSQCVIEYSDYWGRLMQIEIDKGKTISEIAEETGSQISFFGITGFMYGCVIQGLSTFWKHGEELRKWHNKEYNHEGEGVVNPAVITITTKSDE